MELKLDDFHQAFLRLKGSEERMTTVVRNFLLKRKELTPHKTALVYGENRYTFLQLFDVALNYAKKFSPAVKKGDYVGVLMENHERMIFSLLALQLIGARAVLLNTRLTLSELNYQLKDANVSVLLRTAKFDKLAFSNDIPVINIEKLEETTDFDLLEEIDLDDTCSIMYTSGTTGFPKGVIQTYGNHYYSAINSALNLGLTEEDAWICSVPMFHISGYSILMRSLIYGMKVVLFERFDEVETLNAINKENVTMMSVVSTMLVRLEEKITKPLPTSFRCMLLGGGPASIHLLEKCKNKNIPVFQSYGMTETCSQIVTLSMEDAILKLGSAGKALFTSQVKIVNEDKQTCEPMIAGEIWVKGPNVTIGYLNNSNANVEKFTDGWLATGDIGYLDKEGYLFVLDRRSDLIISGGENVYPAEVENVLCSHPSVKEAGVIGISSEQWQEVPIAFVVVSKQVTKEELLAYCQSKLAKYKCPVDVVFLSELPRNASNKLVRIKLRDYIK